MRRLTRGAIEAGLLAVVAAAASEYSGSAYRHLPPRSRFPATREWLLQQRQALSGFAAVAGAERALRARAWALFEGLTSTVQSPYGPLPLWRTWFTRKEVSSAPRAKPVTPHFLLLEIPQQLEPAGASLEENSANPPPLVFSNIFFDKPARDFIRKNGLRSAATLQKWLIAGTAIYRNCREMLPSSRPSGGGFRFTASSNLVHGIPRMPFPEIQPVNAELLRFPRPGRKKPGPRALT